MVLVWSLFSLVLIEAGEQRAAENLGYAGATVRVIAIPADGYGGPDQLTSALVDFAVDHNVSVAYGRSHGTGLVTLLDARGRFRNGEGSLVAFLDPLNAGPAAVVSTAIGGSAGGEAELKLPEGVKLAGTFESDVMFEDRYPVIIFSVEASPFGEGVYLFAGNDSTPNEPLPLQTLVGVFETNGMEIVHLMPQEDSSVSTVLFQNLNQPYGFVVVMFMGIVALVQLMVMLIYASLFRDRLFVAAVLGALRRNLRRITLQRLLRLVFVGMAVGGVSSLAVVLSVKDLTLAGLQTSIKVVPTALAVSTFISILVCWCIAWREARRVARVVPC